MISVPRTEIVEEKTEKAEVSGRCVRLKSFELPRSDTIVRPHSVWFNRCSAVMPRVGDLNLKFVNLIWDAGRDQEAQTGHDASDNQQRDCQ